MELSQKPQTEEGLCESGWVGERTDKPRGTKQGKKEMALTKIILKSSTSSQEPRDIRPPWADSEFTSMPVRLPYHQVLTTPSATPGEPTGDSVWQACHCPWPHLAMRLFSASIQALASQLPTSESGGVAMATLGHGFPEMLPASSKPATADCWGRV